MSEQKRHPMLIDNDQYLAVLDMYAQNLLDIPCKTKNNRIEHTQYLRVQALPPPENQSKKRRKHGFVYLIESSTGAYKIGKTSKPDDRMHTFKTKLPFEVEYLCLIYTNDMAKLERNLHALFADKRINGEWFALTADDVEYIKGMAQ